MNASIKAWINRQRVGKDGLATVYLRVVIDRLKKEIKLDVRWPVAFFDDDTGLCKPRSADDRDCHDANIIIRREVSKCNEIFRYYRLADLPLTMARFLKDYENNLSKSSFIQYMEAKINSRHAAREITGVTKARHIATLNKLKAYNNDLRFADFSETWCADFDKFLKRNIKSQKTKASQNSRWAHHKTVKTYMHCAEKDLVKFVYPYQWFSLGMVEGNWKAIFEKDVVTLYNYYLDKKCPAHHRQILRAFLFSCMTGLRISDIKRITKANVMEGMLIFVPYKTRKNNSMMKIPLNRMAAKLMADAINEDLQDQVFNNFAEQYANRELKEIATMLGITANLHWHVGRHTFISLYYAKTKDLLATKEFAGHKNIKQTMVYTHQNPEEIREKMKAMDDIG
jgi:integrase